MPPSLKRDPSKSAAKTVKKEEEEKKVGHVPKTSESSESGNEDEES